MTTAPMNPKAGVSGPGKFSVRTDKLEMGSKAYGEGVETQAIQSGAPLAKTGDVRPARAGDVREAATQAPVTELFAPSHFHGFTLEDDGELLMTGTILSQPRTTE